MVNVSYRKIHTGERDPFRKEDAEKDVAFKMKERLLAGGGTVIIFFKVTLGSNGMLNNDNEDDNNYFISIALI